MFKILYLIGLTFFFISCEENPDLTVDSKPFPVVYSILNKFDTIHYIYLQKSFSGENGPLVDAQAFDSLFFKNAEVTLSFSTQGEVVVLHTLEQLITNKLPGIFCYPNSKVYVFKQDLSNSDAYSLTVSIPGYPEIKSNSQLINRPIMIYPRVKGSLLTLTQDQPFTVNWQGSFWNDVTISISITTYFTDHQKIDTLAFSKTGIVTPVSGIGIFKFSFKYENFLSILNRTYNINVNVDYRIINWFSVLVFSGSDAFLTYMETLEREKDYIYFMDFNSSKSFGVTASKSNVSVDGLLLDQLSKDFLSNQPTLEKFKFIFW